jgi:hypothetical protein
LQISNHLREIYPWQLTICGKKPGTPRPAYAWNMSGWVKADAKCGVSIERGTPEVPDDGRYHVVVDGEIVLSTNVEAAALAEFEDIREQRRAPQRARLREEQAEAAYRAMRDAFWDKKITRDSRKGGRVGRK